MHLLVPRSRSSAKVKVKCKVYISQKMTISGGIRVSQTLLVLLVVNIQFQILFYICNLFDNNYVVIC